MHLLPDTLSSAYTAVTSSQASVGAMLAGGTYQFACSTNCWIRQGSAKLITCATKANLVDTDYMTITLRGVAVVYEFDTAGDGVTANSGRVRVDVSGATTAASVAAILRTAILANQAALEVTDNSDGTLTVVAPGRIATLTENVAHASFTITAAIVTTTAGAGSMFVPALLPVLLEGDFGAQLGVIRDTADGKSSLTPVRIA